MVNQVADRVDQVAVDQPGTEQADQHASGKHDQRSNDNGPVCGPADGRRIGKRGLA